MDIDNEPRIKIGEDPQGRSIHIDEAAELPQYYRCSVCHEFLIVRHGDIRIWHFAHSTAQAESPECKLRTESGWEEWLREQRVSPVERMEKDRQMRVQIQINPYTSEVNLVGVLPVPSWDEFPHAYPMANVLDSIRMIGMKADSGLSGRAFHPSNPEVVVHLDPNSEGTSITIESTPALVSIIGSWNAKQLSAGDVFIGDWSRAERVAHGWRVNTGDVLYVIGAVDSFTESNLVKTFVLGKYRILAVEICPETERVLKKLFPEMDGAPANFSVSVILPSWIDARSVGPIGGPPGVPVLIGIHPPSGLTPQFEVVTVPLDPERIETISSAGEKGASALYWTKFPSRGSRRISIHWGGSHRLVHLFASQDSLPVQTRPELPVGISIKMKEGNDIFMTPWQSNPELCCTLSEKCQPHVELHGPPEMCVDMIGEKADGGESSRAKESNVDAASINSILGSWTSEGYLGVRVDFGPMGAVAIRYSQEGPVPMTLEEIEKKIAELDYLPNKATWQLLRQIADVPTGTSHHAVKHVRLSQVRIVLKNLRKVHGK